MHNLSVTAITTVSQKLPQDLEQKMTTFKLFFGENI